MTCRWPKAAAVSRGSAKSCIEQRLPMTETPATIRSGRDSDAAGFTTLIATGWAEYPGIVLDVDGEMPELRNLASYYGERRGGLWAAECEGIIVGMVATIPHDAGTWEICRVYTLPSTHGNGLGHRLLD